MSDTIPSKRKNLTISEAELLCSLKASEEVIDPETGEKISKKNPLVEEEIRSTLINLSVHFELLHDQRFKNHLKKAVGTTAKSQFTLLELLAWWTSIRLAFIRFMRLTPVLLPVYFAIGGFSYFIEFFYDLHLILNAARFPKNAREQALTFWQRVGLALNEDGRKVRMFNALLWGVINITGFLIITVLAATIAAALGPYFGTMTFILINLVGYTLDVAVEFHLIKGKTKFNTLLEKLYASKAEHEGQKALLDPKLENNQTALAAINQEIAADNLLISQVEAKRKQFRKDRIRSILVTTSILVGMILIWFPLTSWAGIAIIGASLAVAGSTFGGLGRRLYLLAESFCSACSAMWKRRNNQSMQSIASESDLSIASMTQTGSLSNAVSSGNIANITPTASTSSSTASTPDKPSPPSTPLMTHSTNPIEPEPFDSLTNTPSQRAMSFCEQKEKENSETEPLFASSFSAQETESNSADDEMFLDAWLSEITKYQHSLTIQLTNKKSDIERLRRLLNLESSNEASNEDNNRHLEAQIDAWITHSNDPPIFLQKSESAIPEMLDIVVIQEPDQHGIYNCSVESTLFSCKQKIKERTKEPSTEVSKAYRFR